MANTIPVENFAQLRDAINNAANGDIINITASQIVLTEALPVINKDLTFTSTSGATLRSNGNVRVLTVGGGNVTMRNLTIADGIARGTTGTTGGNGAAGQGGGLLINGGNVTLINMTFRNNQAIGGNGGNNPAGVGGNGGDGQGGAIYVRGNSTLRINNTSFEQNKAVAGNRGTGATPGASGKSQGGGLYIEAGSVLAEGSPGFSNNEATQGRDRFELVPNSYQELLKPLVASIRRVDRLTNETAALNGSLQYEVEFTQDVVGVDVGDFIAINNVDSDFSSVVTAVTAVPGSARRYLVDIKIDPIQGTEGLTGTVRLDLRDNDTVNSIGTAPRIVPLGGTGADNGDFSGETYNINRTPPTAVIERKNAAAQLTAQSTVFYTVRFSEAVRNVGVDDFQLVTSSGITNAQITTITKLNDFNYEVAVSTGNGNGTVGLNVIDNDSILNPLDVPLGGVGTGNGNVTGPTFTIDKTSPQVSSIDRLGNSPTGDAVVNFQVAFTQDVGGVSSEDFVVAGSSGIQGASVLTVTPIDRRTYTVAVNTGSGDGSVGLNLVDNDTIRNDLGVALGGSGNGNGNATGPLFSVLKSSPFVTGINLASANPTAAGSVTFTVNFSQDVRGVDREDFRSVGAGLTNFGISSVSGSGKTYSVVVNTGNGSGSLGLNLVDNDSIVNSINRPLGGAGVGNGNFTGQAYTINKTPPRAIAINRLESSPTNAGVVNFTVSFNEAVTRVDASDFALSTQGLTGAGISSVVRVNDTFYAVAVNTGSGEGTLRLSLVDNDSIINGLGLPLGGAGANNGNLQGEAYAIDRTAPIGDMVDVAPDPRRDKVDAITLQFNEAVRGLDVGDLRLTRDGKAVSLDRATIASADGITWILSNLQRLTNKRGNYALTLAPSGSGITDLAGNALTTSLSEQWGNLVNVEVCAPGIRKRGSKGANRLQGTENSDVLLGLAGNDTLLGQDCRDRLEGDEGNDRLIGGAGRDLLLGQAGDDLLNGGLDQDTLNGGAGADRYVYSGINQNAALENSLAEAPDRIKGFRFSQDDRIQLDYDNNLKRSNRPNGLFNAGEVRGGNLVKAAQNAYRDSDQTTDGNQRLDKNAAVFFEWRGATYLSVNDRDRGFSASRDLIVNISGIQLRSGDADAGRLNVNDYFI
ncbi:MAG: hypothetical protein MUF72_19750 [Elainella sp. Prado103]|jgi:hypothetical protein|nr:hypothetical protein [Elainella sp. Prado103]